MKKPIKILKQKIGQKLCAAHTAGMIAGDSSHKPFLDWYWKKSNPEKFFGNEEKIYSGLIYTCLYEYDVCEYLREVHNIILAERNPKVLSNAENKNKDYFVVKHVKGRKTSHVFVISDGVIYDCNYEEPNSYELFLHEIVRVYEIISDS
jgi:hypothetical protein